ncbi:sensor histidine kinase [Sediminibacterium sp.]|uniref:sensor histidine kinase n=1 Tax=Sediminibacterium sp. TaxID=1917865 RepID=UPI003F69DFDF
MLDGKFYQFSSKFNLVENEDIIRNIFLLFLGILLLLVLGILFITKIFSVSLWKPFYRALDQIEAFEIDKSFTYTEIQSSVAEFDRLNNSVKKLIEKNLLIYQNQKEFIENAAHELQTPLAVFKAKVDALMQYPDLKEEHYAIINSINDNVSKLFRINKNLLLLSKIENNSYQQSESISLIGALSKNIEFFKEQAAAKQIQIETSYASDITLNANTVLLDILISNLFLNAIKYNLQNGFIRISIANNILFFDNDGMDKALRKELLFKRFSMQNVGENSSGLGLSIIKKITDLYQWTIDYQYKDGYHQFKVRF